MLYLDVEMRNSWKTSLLLKNKILQIAVVVQLSPENTSQMRSMCIYFWGLSRNKRAQRQIKQFQWKSVLKTLLRKGNQFHMEWKSPASFPPYTTLWMNEINQLLEPKNKNNFCVTKQVHILWNWKNLILIILT